jgi:RNA polymerase-binding transcription factor DksA
VAQRNLDSIRENLVARRTELLTRQTQVERDLEHVVEPLLADADDQAIQLQNDETLSAIGSAAREEVAAINEALQRLELNLYGVCKKCGHAIPDARLRVAPYAIRCATCSDK